MIRARYIGHGDGPRDLLALARRAIFDARGEAAKLVAAARSRAARRLQAARHRARTEGFAEGRIAGAAELRALLHLDQRYEDVVLAAERDCLELALTIAAEIIGHDLAPSTDLLADRVRLAILNLNARRLTAVRVHPAAVGPLTTLLGQHHPSLNVVADPLIDIGNAVIDTGAGIVELQWQRTLEHLGHRLREELTRSARTETQVRDVTSC